MQNLEKLKIGQHAEEMLNADYQFQLENLPTIKEGVVACEVAKDFVSRELVVDILACEEEHIDWLETQQYLISTMGIENYLQSQIND